MFKELLQSELLSIGNYSLRMQNLLAVAIYLLFVIFFLFTSQRLINRSNRLDKAKKYTVNKLLKYFIAILSLLICLHLLDINISILLTGTAAIMVGLGFGLQKIFNDFISGIILLLDNTLKVGDIIELNNYNP